MSSECSGVRWTRTDAPEGEAYSRAMANEITVPALPCRSIDEIVDFYGMLGFEKTYYQQLPNPYIALKREDINLHFFGMPEFKPEDSYGTCIVIVPDIRDLYEAFAAGMRRTHGKLLVSGYLA